MRSSHPALACILLSFLAAGCASGPDIRADKDPAADLSGYRTFAFHEAGPARGAPYSTILESRLRDETRAQLERRHYVYSEQQPDLRVHVAIAVAEKMELRSAPAGPGYRRWGGHLETVDYRQGTLVIGLVDARRNALVWEGVAEGRIKDASLKDQGPAVREVVNEIFAKLPAARAH